VSVNKRYALESGFTLCSSAHAEARHRPAPPPNLPTGYTRGWLGGGAGRCRSFIKRRSAERGFGSLRRSAEHGFTLLEMLVALAVFSLAALALIRLQAVSIRTTADLAEHQIARIVAHNLMVEAQSNPAPLTVGERDGEIENGGRQWRWEQKVSASGEADIMRVDVRVVSADAASASPAVLTFLKAQP